MSSGRMTKVLYWIYSMAMYHDDGSDDETVEPGSDVCITLMVLQSYTTSFT